MQVQEICWQNYGNQVYATGLERFGNVFVPVKATAKAELSEAKSLTSKDKFRLTFDMFSGRK